MKVRRDSALHLQLGQETIYFLLTTAILISVVLAVYVTQLVRAQAAHSAEIQKLTDDLETVGAVVKQQQRALLRFDPNMVTRMPSATPNETKKKKEEVPPILSLAHADNCFFALGSARLDSCFRSRISQSIPELVSLSRIHDASIIEVIGHTDHSPLRSRGSNMDDELIDFLNGSTGATLSPADNTGLGMARAAAVTHLLSQDPRLKQFDILPYSAGQAVSVNDTRARSSSRIQRSELRRIEIRLRKRWGD